MEPHSQHMLTVAVAKHRGYSAVAVLALHLHPQSGGSDSSDVHTTSILTQ